MASIMAKNKKYSWSEIFSALTRKKSLAMFILGFAAGLPYVLITGTLNAWFTNENISISTIGVFSWVIIIYSFKFLWAPAIDGAPTPPLFRMGRKRTTILILQSIILLCLYSISTINPSEQIGWIAIAAVLCTFASASQDVLIDAWRIEVADEETTVDLLSSLYQFGYRSSVILGGAGALIIAARIGWNQTFIVLTVLMSLAVSGVFLAEDSKVEKTKTTKNFNTPTLWRNLGVLPIVLGWVWSFYTLFSFMAKALTHPDETSARAFILETGPFIIIASIIFPIAASAYLLKENKPDISNKIVSMEQNWPLQSVLNILYGSILLPMSDLIKRLKWSFVLVITLVLSYRFADLIWGAFAYPFYLGENYGALGHTLDEVAIASKLLGALMTFFGIGIGGLLILKIGRMPSLFIGAVLAAATNLLFADLAQGGQFTDVFMTSTNLYALFGFMQPLADFLSLDVTANKALSRLMLVIAAENLAVGFASAAIVVYLSSIVSKKHAAVQYALLASLGFLLGSLGRGAIGELIETQGFAYVFYLTAALGSVAIVASGLEWIRQTKINARPAP